MFSDRQWAIAEATPVTTSRYPLSWIRAAGASPLPSRMLELVAEAHSEHTIDKCRCEAGQGKQ